MREVIHDEEQEVEAVPPGRLRRRLAFVLIALLVVLLLAFIPPLINVSRFQRRVDGNISASLGRPVHFSRLSLNLLPLPGFTLENFVIDEDPAFGSEPTLSADEVRITLRLSSLWRRRVEFSSISFTDPSVNLVHNADGHWNIQGLLLQASRIQAAPTAQRYPGPAPRFPYIEATGARLNLKLGEEKTPVSLTDADFALWLPEEHQWHLRLEAHPLRTDIAPGETGTLRVEGTMGGADTHDSLAEVPIDLHGTWQDAQLGGLTSLLLGRDAGLRGGLSLDIGLLGTVGRNAITASLALNNARRADFLPTQPLSLEAGCHAIAENSFHAFSNIQCNLPPAASSDARLFATMAAVPDVRHLETSSLRIDVPALPAQTFFGWLSVATPHPPAGFTGDGTLGGALAWGAANAQPAEDDSPITLRSARSKAQPAQSESSQPTWSGELTLSGESLTLPSLGPEPLALGDVVLRSTPAAPPPARSRHGAAANLPLSAPTPPDSFDLLPVSLPLGGKQPAVLTGHVDDTGYTLHLNGTAVPQRLLALGDAIPQFGDGLKQLLAPAPDTPPTPQAEAPVSSRGRGRNVPAPSAPPESAPVPIDLTVTRAWGGPQVWTQAPTEPVPPPAHRHARK